MKQNPKEQVNIIELGQEFIKKLNEQCKATKVQKVYEVTIKDGKLKSDNRVGKEIKDNKTFKTLKFTVADLETNERITLFSTDYVFKNPADVLKKDYKRVLYREFFYGAVVVFAFNMEATIKQRRMEEVLTKPSTFAEHPVTPDEAINPADFAAPNDVV